MSVGALEPAAGWYDLKYDLCVALMSKHVSHDVGSTMHCVNGTDMQANVRFSAKLRYSGCSGASVASTYVKYDNRQQH